MKEVGKGTQDGRLESRDRQDTLSWGHPPRPTSHYEIEFADDLICDWDLRFAYINLYPPSLPSRSDQTPPEVFSPSKSDPCDSSGTTQPPRTRSGAT